MGVSSGKCEEGAKGRNKAFMACFTFLFSSLFYIIIFLCVIFFPGSTTFVVSVSPPIASVSETRTLYEGGLGILNTKPEATTHETMIG